MPKKITFEELIIKMMPFSSELIDWCNHHPEFQSALKIIYSDRFICLQAIVLSESPSLTIEEVNDEVIGVYVYDYRLSTPLFKQDFIVNIGKQNKEFVLYTRNPRGKNSKYVKDINVFYQTYGKNGDYVNSHHLTFDQLPEEIKARGVRVIQLAEKISKFGGFVKPTQSRIDKANTNFGTVGRKVRTIKQKLRK